MMYHHVNVAHDYFMGTFGFEALDFAWRSSMYKSKPIPPLLMPGPDGWVGLSNAALFPRESWQQFAAQFGLLHGILTASFSSRAIKISPMIAASSITSIPMRWLAQADYKRRRYWTNMAWTTHLAP